MIGSISVQISDRACKDDDDPMDEEVYLSQPYIHSDLKFAVFASAQFLDQNGAMVEREHKDQTEC